MTLTGPAGIGKTRLAHEVARELPEVVVADDATPALELGERPVVATSRAPLGLPGEHVYELRPLAEAPAVELFRLHAEEARPGFDAPYAELVEVCRRLGLVPRAILHAARSVDSN